MKTIVINALSALQGGGQTYLNYLFEHPDESGGIRTVVIHSNTLNLRARDFPLTSISPGIPLSNIVSRFLWEREQLPKILRQYHADILYCPGGILPLRSDLGCRLAVACRNMLPFSPDQIRRYPLGYMRMRLRLLRSIQIRSFRRADLVIFVSDHARNTVGRMIPPGKGKSVVIPHGVGELFRRKDAKTLSPLPFEYVLYVSYVDVYKNQMEVVRSWKKLKELRPTSERLVLVGPGSPAYLEKLKRLIHRYGLDGDVLIAGSVPAAALPAYYSHAKIILFASSCENCPNVLLEGMASGRPVLSSNVMPMPEFGGDAVLYFNPGDPDELAGLFVRTIDNPELCSRMGKASYERSLSFDAGASAKETWEAILALTGERG